MNDSLKLGIQFSDNFMDHEVDFDKLIHRESFESREERQKQALIVQ